MQQQCAVIPGMELLIVFITGIMTLYCTATSKVPDEEEIDDGKLISSSAYVHLKSVYCTSFRNRCC